MKFYYNEEVIAWLYLFVDEHKEDCPFKNIYNIATNLSISFDLAYNIWHFVLSVLLFKDCFATNRVVTIISDILEAKANHRNMINYCKNNIKLFKDKPARTFINAINNIDPYYDENYYLLSSCCNINLIND